MFRVQYVIHHLLELCIRNWSGISPNVFREFRSEGFVHYVVGLFIRSSIRILLLIVLGTGFVVSVTRELSIKLILAVAVPITVYAVLDLFTLIDKCRMADWALEFRIKVQTFKRRRGREPKDRLEIIIDFYESEGKEFYDERAKDLYERLGKDLTA